MLSSDSIGLSTHGVLLSLLLIWVPGFGADAITLSQRADNGLLRGGRPGGESPSTARPADHRSLRFQFKLDDDAFEALKEELIYGQRMAVDEDERVLVWMGDTELASSPPASMPVSAQVADPKHSPISYTPQQLTEKILTSRSTLEGERKQVTVLFADIKDSTELIRDLDPQAAQQLLEPAIHT